MKAALALVLTALGLGLVVGVVLARVALRERRRCGHCAYFDEALRCCWAKDCPADFDNAVCETYKEKEQ